MKLEDLKTINPEECRALEDIVGPDFISIEPNILDGYCFSWGNELAWKSRFATRPLGVVLPGNTEEVQAIVKACNRFKITFKAHSTGFGSGGLEADNQFLSIDLRRMDRILEIDEKNMIAVFEPYVSFGGLTNACIKKGVRPYNIGAGPSASPLANATNVQGHGTVNVSAGWGGRVPLALEWVLPNGELLRTGTLGTCGQWFSGDGPGPSLRGILRGATGPMGSMGVFTKLAIKVVPWYGPPKVEFYGDPPKYKVKLPKEIDVLTFMFPTRKALVDAMLKIQEEKIAYWCSRRGPFTMAAAMTGSNKDVLEQWQSPEFQERLARFNHNLSLGLDSSSPREFDFKRKAAMKIMKMFDGELFEEDENGMTARFVHAFNGLGAVKGTFRSTGGMSSNPSCEEAIDAVSLACDRGVDIKNQYSKEGICLDDGDSTWFTLEEDGWSHMEVPFRYDPTDEASIEGTIRHAEETNKAITDWNLGIGEFECGFFTGRSVHDYAGPRTMNYQTWVGRIKTILDPNLVGEATRYPAPIRVEI
jgi:glycolate oxidase